MSPEVLAILKAVGYVLGALASIGVLAAAIRLSFAAGSASETLKGLGEKLDSSTATANENLAELKKITQEHENRITKIEAARLAEEKFGRRVYDKDVAHGDTDT